MSYTKGMRDYARRRAANIFDRWVDETGVIHKHTSYYYELLGVIEDAVECGAQAALGVEHALDIEKEAEPDDS